MSLLKTIAHGALVLAFVLQTMPHVAWASPATEIALKNKMKALNEEAQLVESLKEARLGLVQALDEIERLEAKDYSSYAAKTNLVVGGFSVTTLVAFSLFVVASSRTPKTTDFLLNRFPALAPVLLGGAILGLQGSLLANLVGISDLLLSKNVNYKDLNEKIDVALLQLEEVEKELVLESEKALVWEISKNLEEARDVASVEKREEIYKRIMVVSGIVLWGSLYKGLTLKSSDAYFMQKVAGYGFGLGAASATQALAGLVGEDKELVIEKLQEAISVLDEAILSVESN